MFNKILHMTTNRNPLQKWFITFPKSGSVEKTDFLKILEELSLTYYIICKETHLDGTPHLHAVIWLKDKLSKSKVLKFFKEKYPDSNKRIHVKSVRNLSASIEYCKKEDAQYLESPSGPPKRAYRYPAWMVSACKAAFKRTPEEMAAEFREETSRLQLEKSKIDFQLRELSKQLPYSQTQCDILETKLKLIVETLSMRFRGM